MEYDKYKSRSPLPLPWGANCKRWLLLAALGMAATTSASEVVINLDVGSPPTMYESPDGQALGIYPEILRQAFERIDASARIQSRPFRRVIAELETGSAAAGAFIVTPERKAKYDFSAPYFIEHVAVFGPANLPAFTTLADLKGRRVGVISGWSYGVAFDRAVRAGDFQIEAVGRDWQNFEKLQRGRLDYVVATELAGRVWLLNNTNSGIAQGKAHLVSASIHLAFNKRLQQGKLLARFEQAVFAMQRNGEIERIVARQIEHSKTTLKAASNAFSPAATQ